MLAGAAVVETSARAGTGIDGLRSALDAASAAIEPRSADGAARLPIDRAFTSTGSAPS